MSTCWGHTYFLRIETKERNAFCLTNVTNKIKSYSVRRCGISGWALIGGGGLNFWGGGFWYGRCVARDNLAIPSKQLPFCILECSGRIRYQIWYVDVQNCID